MTRKNKSLALVSNDVEVNNGFDAQLTNSTRTPEETKLLAKTKKNDNKRLKMMREIVQPYVELEFARNPGLQTAVACVAQYWNDQASDETHCDLAYSKNDMPAFENIEYDRGEWDEKTKTTKWDGRDFYLGVSPYSYYIGGKMTEKGLRDWPGQSDAIPLFAAFCKEGNQENDFADNYTPYAVFRRQPDGVSLEIVGTMQRPWLDGVRPEWENE
jgi:hypothetical protein